MNESTMKTVAIVFAVMILNEAFLEPSGFGARGIAGRIAGAVG